MIGVSRKIRMISLDPGSRTLGLAVFEYDLSSGNRNVLFTQTLDTDEGLKNLRYMEDIYGTKYVRLKVIGNFLKGHLEDWQPDVVIMESPFAGQMIQAFKVLVEVMMIIEESVSNYGSAIALLKIDPPTVKKVHKVPGNSGDKTLMRAAVMAIGQLTLAEGMSFDNMSEHEIDAIAVGNYYCVAELGGKG